LPEKQSKHFVFKSTPALTLTCSWDFKWYREPLKKNGF